MSLEQHLAGRLNETAMQEHNSGPYGVVEKIFPGAMFGDLLAGFPTALNPITTEPKRNHWNASRRVEMQLPRDLDAIDESAGRKLWTQFSDAVQSAVVVRAMMLRLGIEGETTDFRIVSRVCRHLESHYLGPHTDHKKKVASIIFYFPDTAEEDPSLGTAFYRHRLDPAFECDGSTKYRFDDFEEVSRVGFAPNRALFFARTNRSFHGVALMTPEKAQVTDRKIVQTEIWQK